MDLDCLLETVAHYHLFRQLYIDFCHIQAIASIEARMNLLIQFLQMQRQGKIPGVSDNYFIENRQIHSSETRQIQNLYTTQAKTNLNRYPFNTQVPMNGTASHLKSEK